MNRAREIRKLPGKTEYNVGNGKSAAVVILGHEEAVKAVLNAHKVLCAFVNGQHVIWFSCLVPNPDP